MSNELVPLNELEKMAATIAKSGLFGVKTADQAMAIMLVAQSEGLHPMAAVQAFDIIQGRPSRKAWSMLERFQASGGRVEWHERTDTKAAATFTHPLGGSVRIDWDIDRAKKAGLAGKDNWHKFTRQMLSARVISEGVRTVYPGATGGFYTPEESREMEDVTPKKPARQTQTVEVVDAQTGEVTEQRMPVKTEPKSLVNPTPENPFGFPADGGELGPREPELGALQPAAEAADPDYDAAETKARAYITKILAATDADAITASLRKNQAIIEAWPLDIKTVVYEQAAARKKALGA